VCMALAGCARLADIGRSTLWPALANLTETPCC